MNDSAPMRERMVETQIAARGVRDEAVLAAMRSVPRERYVPPSLREFAYDDTPLGIGSGQTISQPYVVAWMAEALELQAGDRVLEVGTGSGYAAAVLSRIAGAVFTIERHPELAERATRDLAAAGFANVKVRTGDGTLGWPEEAPFDAILVSAGGPDVPPTLLAQLAPGGRLVIPVGPTPRLQELVRIRRTPEGNVRETLGRVQFVPL